MYLHHLLILEDFLMIVYQNIHLAFLWQSKPVNFVMQVTSDLIRSNRIFWMINMPWCVIYLFSIGNLQFSSNRKVSYWKMPFYWIVPIRFKLNDPNQRDEIKKLKKKHVLLRINQKPYQLSAIVNIAGWYIFCQQLSRNQDLWIRKKDLLIF